MNATEDFEDVALWLRSIHGVCLALLLLASLAGNSFLVVLVFSHRKLQYRSVLSSLSLVAADLLITVTWSTQGLTNIIAGSCPFGDVGCTILGILTNIGIYARWCIIALITVERFCKVIFPFHYVRYSKPLLITLSIFCWIVPIATAVIPPLANVGEYTFRINFSVCIVTCDSTVGDTCFRFYIVLYGFFVSIGGILPIILYLLLCIVGHRKAYKMKHIQLGTFRKTDVTANGGKNVNEQDEENNRSQDGSPASAVPRLDSTSSGSSWGGALEKKILITFFAVFVNVFVTQLPIYGTNALRGAEEIYDKIPQAVHFVFVYIYLLGSVLDPLLIMRNKDFRDVILRRWKKKKAQKLQRSSQSATWTQSTSNDFAKISSFFDTGLPNSRMKTRRNSCPSNLQSTIIVQKLATARSLDGGGITLEKVEEEDILPEQETTRHNQIKIEEVEEESLGDGRRSSLVYP
jgi:hypothetical protein